MSAACEVWTGPAALSAARRARKLRELRRLEPALRGVFAEYVHFLFAVGEIAPRQRTLIAALLAYGPRRDRPSGLGEPFCTVTPRLGTVSPWSSKATDIFRRGGLQVVARVERGVRWHIDGPANPALAAALHDRMTETVIFDGDFSALAREAAPQPLAHIALAADPAAALDAANERLGLALSEDEVAYLAQIFGDLGRDPTDVELMMFAQANSEHCRHKIFNADWRIDGEPQPKSLFAMIRNTYQRINGEGILSAYADNAAVVEGGATMRFFPDADRVYRPRPAAVHVLMKVETHNHPTAIAPHPGAATGAGGEIRDEGAVGRGSKPKAGLVGFATSHLHLDGSPQPWELDLDTPAHIACARDIMLEAPLGAASFNNEYGRPCLAGYFRTFEARSHRPGEVWGYHKPVMIAGGVGAVAAEHVHAGAVPAGAALVVLGGPALLIGLGGGAASSKASGESDSELDFASVQRDNAEMQRRCQEVIDRCCALGDANPIRLIHDVGAGGLSNALPELIHDAGVGGRFDIRAVPCADPALSPMAIWCNEAQERYVLAIAAEELPAFAALCARERCPYAVVGEATRAPQLVVGDSKLPATPVDLPPGRRLFGKPPKMTRRYRSSRRAAASFDHRGIALDEAIHRVLRFPAVARQEVSRHHRRSQHHRPRRPGSNGGPPPSAGGRRGRDAGRLRGPPRRSHGHGRTLAGGPWVDPAAAARLAVAEALTNLAAAPIERLRRVVLSANWMAAAGQRGRRPGALRGGSHRRGGAVPRFSASPIPGGQGQSLHANRLEWTVPWWSPVTLIVSAFAPVNDARPDADARRSTPARGALHLIEPPFSTRRRLGGSAPGASASAPWETTCRTSTITAL